MEKHCIVCLGREYGSGGHNIGRRVAQMLGFAYYDKQLLDEAARNSGISQEYFARSDERAPGSLAHTLASGLFAQGGMFMYNNSLSPESIFKFQSDAIVDIATRSSCVIVGRCADYILREHPDMLSVFITAPLQQRTLRVARRENLPVEQAREKAKKIDKIRKEYYNFFTDKRWGHASSYHLCIDSSRLGEEGTAAFVRDFIQARFRLKP